MTAEPSKCDSHSPTVPSASDQAKADTSNLSLAERRARFPPPLRTAPPLYDRNRPNTPKTAPLAAGQHLRSSGHNLFFFNSLSRKKKQSGDGAQASGSVNEQPTFPLERPSLRRSLTTRTEYLRDHIKSGTATFFGVSDNVEACMQKWNNRRMRHCSRRYGGVKTSEPTTPVVEELNTADLVAGSRPEAGTLSLQSAVTVGGRYSRSVSRDSYGHAIPVDDVFMKRAQMLHRRDSVAKLAWDGLSSMINRTSSKRRLSLKNKLQKPASRNFSPFSSTSLDEDKYGSGSGQCSIDQINAESTVGAGGTSADPAQTTLADVCSPVSVLATEDSVFTTSAGSQKAGKGQIQSTPPHKPAHIHFSTEVSEIGPTLKEPTADKWTHVPQGVITTSDNKETQRKRRSSLKMPPISKNETEISVYRCLSLEDRLPSTERNELSPSDDVFFDLSPLSLGSRPSRSNSFLKKTSKTEDPSRRPPKAPPSSAPGATSTSTPAALSQRSVRWSLFDDEAADEKECVISVGADGVQYSKHWSPIDVKQPRLEFYLPLPDVDEEVSEELNVHYQDDVHPAKRLVLRRFSLQTNVQEPSLPRKHQQAASESSSPITIDSPGAFPRQRRLTRQDAVRESFPGLLRDRDSEAKLKLQQHERQLDTGQEPNIQIDWRQTSARIQEEPNYYYYSPLKKRSSGLGVEIHQTVGRIWEKVLSKDSERRVYGEGVVGKFFRRTLRKLNELEPHVKRQLDDFDDYRPYFTYWIMTVHVLVLLISLMSYGFGPIGFARTQYTGFILQTSQVLEQVAYFEPENFWIGPRYADLVQLGAKYSPCMRRDKNVETNIEKIRQLEKDSACCIRNDRTGCVQTSKNNCPALLATWYKWDPVTGNSFENRTSGSVCNQDPRECRKPSSIQPFKWPDDITKWPICNEKTTSTPNLPHTKCVVTGRPCCLGLLGECRITTKEYCSFVKGYFHEEAALCSQVSCLSEVCGMIPFVNDDYPDQFYRLFLSLFLHAGILHCMFTLIVQYLLMRDLEKLIGWLRLSIIYLGSGIFGNLASAVFVPYEPEVGPAGCHFGLLAALLVDAIYSRHMIMKPWKAVVQILLVLGFLFLLGLLPWVDNWAHTFGFICGLLLSLALFPYIQFKTNDFRRRLIVVGVCLSFTVIIFVGLLILFYFKPLWTCNWCVNFNCLPLTEHLCDNVGLALQPLPF